jgi:integrase
LVAEFESWLAADGRGSRCYRDAAWAFLGRWNDPAAFAAEPLQRQLALLAPQRAFVTFLMLTGRLRPGYDFLAHRKLGGLLARGRRGPFAADLTRFTTAATDLDYSGHIVKRSAERVALRLLIQTGRRLHELRIGDLDELAAACRRSGETKGNHSGWRSDRELVFATHQVLFHLGIFDTPPDHPLRRDGLDGYCSKVPEPLRTLFLDYCAQAAATRAPTTVKSIAGHLGAFGRFLASLDPPVTDLASLDRHAHIEPWLAALAQARRADGVPISVGYRRVRIIAIRQFLTDILEWGWPVAPPRTVLFARDIPPLKHPLPRYLPPDADRRLSIKLQGLSAGGPTELARLHADALLLLRATGLRIGELRDLELDCVHEIPEQGAWLKVPLGKLGTERMVPLDDETLVILDRVAARRTPGRPLRHPRTGNQVEFLLVYQGRRISDQAIREQLARVCQDAGLPKTVPHALRHTYATALVNAGVSLQALMHLLGHVSAAMSLRYGRLFDATVRTEYERALTQAKAQLTPAPAASAPVPAGTRQLPLVAITGGADWKDSATIKSRLSGGFCLRAPAQGSCAYANICEHCPNFRTDPSFLAILSTQRIDAHALAADAEARGWTDEAARHHRLVERLDQLLTYNGSE